MSRTTPAPGFARLGAVGRKAARHHAQRQRHQQRELAEALRERVAREGWPVRDDGPAPRID